MEARRERRGPEMVITWESLRGKAFKQAGETKLTTEQSRTIFCESSLKDLSLRSMEVKLVECNPYSPLSLKAPLSLGNT
jgi:hypothetical protein